MKKKKLSLNYATTKKFFNFILTFDSNVRKMSRKIDVLKCLKTVSNHLNCSKNSDDSKSL